MDTDCITRNHFAPRKVRKVYCIIAGSRLLTKEETYEAIKLSGISEQITYVISGKALHGGDLYGEEWANENNIPVVPFPAKWNDMTEPCVTGYRNGVQYNKLAGFNRNEEMAKFCCEKNGQVIAVLKGKSSGTKDMIKRAKAYKLLTHVFVAQIT